MIRAVGSHFLPMTVKLRGAIFALGQPVSSTSCADGKLAREGCSRDLGVSTAMSKFANVGRARLAHQADQRTELNGAGRDAKGLGAQSGRSLKLGRDHQRRRHRLLCGLRGPNNLRRVANEPSES
jgi:hypothetical protein